MLLKSIDIQGFKSFADKTSLKFGKGITAIVGPNGSGKSNISDAVRWVLGEQSTKNLRGKRMEDVVFGGTSQRRSVGYAEVTLSIDNADRTLNIDSDTVSVTRRYYRSGESEYKINNAAVRLKDIHELFMDTGLGRDGYSIIGQGKIDSIIGTKASERRDIFEEASGISKYRYRKTEAENKLFQAEENLLRLKDIMSELEGRIEPLREQSDKAQKFLEYSEQKKQLEIGLWLISLEETKEKLRNQEYKISLIQSQLAEIEGSLKEIENSNEADNQKIAEIAMNIDTLQRTASEMEEKAVHLEGEIAILENTIVHNNESILRLTGEIDSLGNLELQSQTDLENKRTEVEAKRLQAERISQSIEQAGQQLENLNLDSENISNQIAELSKQLNLISGEISNWQVKTATAQSSLNEITSRKSVIDTTLIEKSAQLDKYTNDKNELDKHLSELEEEINSLQNTQKGYELRLISRQEKADSIKDRLDKLKLDIEERKRRIRILTDLERNMEGFSFSVKAVLKEASQGILTGIHGPVSRLINVPDNYSVAIEIALGAALQNIVVDSETDAKRAIEFLKRNNKGRATFLPISTIKPNVLNIPSLKDSSGFVGIAHTLVSCSSKYENIIKYLLGRTIISEDIDSGIAIARKLQNKYRVVTLDGQVINAGGSLTGGSVSKNTGLLTRSAEIKRLNAKINELNTQLLDTNTSYNEAVAEKAKAEAELNNTQAVLKTAQEDKIRVVGEIRRISEQLEETSKSYQQLLKEQYNIEDRIKELDGVLSNAAKQIQRLEATKVEKQAEIESISGGGKELAQRREALLEQLTGFRLEQIEIQKDIEALYKSIDDIEASISDRTNRRKDLYSQIEDYKEKNKQNETKIEQLAVEIKSIKDKSGQIKLEINELVKQRSAVEHNLQELRRQEREILTQRENISGEKVRLEARKETMLNEFDSIVNRLYDEYELTRSEAESLGIVIENPNQAKRSLNELKNKIKGLGNVNVGAIEEYKEVYERYQFMSEQIEDVEMSRDELNRLINQLTSQMKEQFAVKFEQINKQFVGIFSELFGGGTAELKLTDPDNVLDSGIDIIAQPPGKKLSSLELLSGGEKALIALCIYFAVMKVNPPPFCIMDEVETALDDVNVDRVAEYMRKISDNTQFICITHRRGTMETADMLYGVTMQEKGVSKLLELNIAELEKTLLVNNRR